MGLLATPGRYLSSWYQPPPPSLAGVRWAWLLLDCPGAAHRLYLRPPRAALSPRGRPHLIGLAFATAPSASAVPVSGGAAGGLPAALTIAAGFWARPVRHGGVDPGVSSCSPARVFLLGLRGARLRQPATADRPGILGLTPWSGSSIQLARRCRPASANGERMARHGLGAGGDVLFRGALRPSPTWGGSS